MGADINFYWFAEDILLILFFLWQQKYLFKDPITGGNGHANSNELAQMVLIYSLVYIIRIDSRTVGHPVDPSIAWALVVAVSTLAGIKEGVFKDIFNKKDK
jgi:hypothetical protein